MTTKTESDLQQAQANLQALQSELDRLEQQKAQVLGEADSRWEGINQKSGEISIPPARKDIFVERFAVAWVPYHVVRAGGRVLTLPAFKL